MAAIVDKDELASYSNMKENFQMHLRLYFMSTHFCWTLKHTTTLFALSDHYILSREWRVIVDQV